MVAGARAEPEADRHHAQGSRRSRTRTRRSRRPRQNIPFSTRPGWGKDYADPLTFFGPLFDGRNIIPRATRTTRCSASRPRWPRRSASRATSPSVPSVNADLDELRAELVGDARVAATRRSTRSSRRRSCRGCRTSGPTTPDVVEQERHEVGVRPVRRRRSPTPTWRSSDLSALSAAPRRSGRGARRLALPRWSALSRYAGSSGPLVVLLAVTAGHVRRSSTCCRRATRPLRFAGKQPTPESARADPPQPRPRQAVVRAVRQVRQDDRHGRRVRLAGPRLLLRLERPDPRQDHREGAAHALADRRRRGDLAAAGIPIGVLSAVKRRTIVDRVAMGFALFGISAPVFWLGLMALFIFWYKLDLHGRHGLRRRSPRSPSEWASHLILPWIVLALLYAAIYARMVRGNLLDTMGEDYIRTARAKGLSERTRDLPPRPAREPGADRDHVRPRRRAARRRRGHHRERLQPRRPRLHGHRLRLPAGSARRRSASCSSAPSRS